VPVVEECENGVDDDDDDLADCRDPDCAMDPACPAACGDDTDFRVLACRIEALAARTEAVADDEPFTSDATGVLSKASASAGSAAVACDDGNRGRARRGLRQLGKRSAKYGKRVRSKPGRQAIPEANTRDDLSSDARRIRTLAKSLRRAVICPPAS
jgi:hypothetical protein